MKHTELDVYQRAFEAAMNVFRLSKTFPTDEKYSLTDQIRRSSRSVCANLAEAWRKRRYEAAFISKLSDSESEASETQVWIQFAVKCEYVPRDEARQLYEEYESVIAQIVHMVHNSKDWIIP
ncbi:MAG: four helix bundle protein [Planctomycetota bacterium]|nr:four helix bundle protein [Planctomycetota bacterium]